MSLNEGDLIVFFTDGLVENIENQKGLHLNSKHISRIIDTTRNAADNCQAIIARYNELNQTELQEDDLTVLVIKWDMTIESAKTA
ncbi:SpoIIE family protein phosphatase [Pseudobacteriovorax antillogorgiicola]|uniref:SpoIIE family protein phosphatase n=1 Tax=Pseudobacteriovorax antillogorgiicola TaxID=1513793 RepID=UPI0022859D40|nr:SpoIIE family protein phosphatase [Pseudobacteriovorax antillogorgiicola]